jgi:hypothetical protein
MKAFRNRAAEKARQAASGGDGPPAGREPVGPADVATPTTADRGALRKRLRQVRRVRAAMLEELGTLVMEMHRQGRHDPALVGRKSREVAAVDQEARALALALERGDTLAQVMAAGIVGTCPSCKSLIGAGDRFCSTCGTPASAASNGQPGAPAAPAGNSSAVYPADVR